MLMLMPMSYVSAPFSNAVTGIVIGHLMILVINSDHGKIHFRSLYVFAVMLVPLTVTVAAGCNHPIPRHLMTSVISCNHSGQSILWSNLAPTMLMTEYLASLHGR